MCVERQKRSRQTDRVDFPSKNQQITGEQFFRLEYYFGSAGRKVIDLTRRDYRDQVKLLFQGYHTQTTNAYSIFRNARFSSYNIIYSVHAGRFPELP